MAPIFTHYPFQSSNSSLSLLVSIDNTSQAIVLNYDSSKTPVRCTSFDQLRDHADPLGSCSLLKACFVASGIIGLSATSFHSTHQTLDLALQALFGFNGGGGIELQVRSSLPYGSGLGTSSILSAMAVLVLKRLVGDNDFSIRQSLYVAFEVEQLMNTGGGWQDQVGGVLGGFKSTICPAEEPLVLEPKQLQISNEFRCQVEKRLLVVFTGKTRLAKNLLQEVLMKWAGQDPAVVDTLDKLVAKATECEEAIEKGDLSLVGKILTDYFAHKRFLSRTGLQDPPILERLVRLLEPAMDGFSLAGAGGGGFLVVILKPGQERDQVVERVQKELEQELKTEALQSTLQSESLMHQVDGHLIWDWKVSLNEEGLVLKTVDVPIIV